MRMKMILTGLLLACFLTGTAGAQQKERFAGALRDRIVFIDLERVFNEFYKTELAKSQVEIQKADVDKEHNEMVAEMQIMDEEIEVLREEIRDKTLDEEVRDSKRIVYEERLIELRNKQKEIAEFDQLRQNQLQLQVTRMSSTVMDEIKQMIVEYAQTEGLKAVIDSSSRRSKIGVFIYTHPDIDITDMIIARLNSKRPEGTELDVFSALKETPETKEPDAPEAGE